MLNTRMTVIIRELMKADTPVTSEYLAKVLDVTSRTIRNDVRELESIIADFGAEIKSIRGTGYQLIVQDDHLFRQLLQEAADNKREQNSEVPTLPEERVRYVIKRLLLSEEYIKLDDIADELFISKSTLQNDLKDVKDVFRRYGISLKSKPNFGLKVKGEEFNLRLCIADHIFNNIENEMDIDNNHVPLFLKDDLDTIRKIILDRIIQHNIALSDIGLNNLVIHIVIAYNRIKNEKYVSLVTQELAELKKQQQYLVAEEIVNELQRELGVAFPEEEIAYITIHLLGTKMVTELHLDETKIQGIIDQQIYEIVKEIIDTVADDLHLNIKDDHELFVALSLHLRPAIHRFHYGINLPNPLLDDIKAKYPAAFQAAVIAGIVLKRRLNIDINENEMGYLALHLGAAMENQKIDNTPKKCMIVCASGVGSARLLASKIQSKFGSRIEIVGTTDFYKIGKIPLDSLDFLISTIPIPQDMPIPVIQVNTILGGSDLDKIEMVITESLNQRLKYLKEELVFLQMNFATKEEVLKFLGDKLLTLGLVDDQYLDSVFEREALSPTSYGNFVAIPHPLTPKTDSTFWTICTLQKPIDWSGKRVQFVCLLNVEKNSSTDLQSMYDLLVQIIDDSQVVQQLIKCKTFKEFEAIFRKA
ncbi:BglG family transcription antiterminator [Neobacillus niacini]|uniref:BglG family transcription antiterminator n=1 Tax=Neobacillus niacini TaxID=86668 RepID=UPI0021CB8489|nr:BglG family transcription antiterminator [Neobacillus niacini]MCM3765964.1 BglG family transcription antiterminator [Neobacillus niacini]